MLLKFRLYNEVSMYKYASSSAVISGDTLTYTIEITNDGTFENTDLVFKDELPEGVSFVEGTVKVGLRKRMQTQSPALA